jgi:hypothetical protein
MGLGSYRKTESELFPSRNPAIKGSKYKLLLNLAGLLFGRILCGFLAPIISMDSGRPRSSENNLRTRPVVPSNDSYSSSLRLCVCPRWGSMARWARAEAVMTVDEAVAPADRARAATNESVLGWMGARTGLEATMN